MSELVEQLAVIVGRNHILLGKEIGARNTSFWDASPMQGRALVRPSSTEQVSEILATCNQLKQPVTVISGNTGPPMKIINQPGMPSFS